MFPTDTYTVGTARTMGIVFAYGELYISREMAPWARRVACVRL